MKRIGQFSMYALSFLLLVSDFSAADGFEGKMPEPITVGNIGQGWAELDIVGCTYPPGNNSWRAIWVQGRMSANDTSTLRSVHKDARSAFQLPDPGSALVFVYTNTGQPSDYDRMSILHQGTGAYHFTMDVGAASAERVRDMWICPSPTDGDFGRCAHFEVSNVLEALTELCGPLP